MRMIPAPPETYGCTGPVGRRITRLPITVVALASSWTIGMSSKVPSRVWLTSNSTPIRPPALIDAPNVPLPFPASSTNVRPANGVSSTSADASDGIATSASALDQI